MPLHRCTEGSLPEALHGSNPHNSYLYFKFLYQLGLTNFRNFSQFFTAYPRPI